MSTIKVYGVEIEFCDLDYHAEWRVIDWDGIDTMQDRAEFMEDNHDEICDAVEAAFLKVNAERNEYHDTMSCLEAKEWAHAAY